MNVVLNDINGGSFRVTLGKRWEDDTCSELIFQEMLETYSYTDEWEDFRARVENTKRGLLVLLRTLAAEGKTVLGYGASTKGNVLLQYCGIDLPAIADVNRYKFGRCTPGTNIPIISEREARAMKPDAYLVLPWHFRDGIIEREREFLEGGGELIFPLPTLEIVSSKSMRAVA